ncbi:hypothetical protein ACP275_13G156300 [Erythranthe tilingii]
MLNFTCFLSRLLLHWRRSKRSSFYALISLLLLCLLAYNSASIFCIRFHFPAKAPTGPAIFLPEYAAGETRMPPPVPAATKIRSGVKLNTRLRLMQKNRNLVVLTNRTAMHHPKRRKRHALIGSVIKILESEGAEQFEARVNNFFEANSSDSSCELRFFMTWISSSQSFGERELYSLESVFKSHPNGCLVIASNSLDSISGMQILKPFAHKGFKVTAISPDFNFLFKNTAAQAWYNQLKQGNVNPGEVSLGQNLSNLLRIGLLYRFGGIYIDTDIIVLKSFAGLKNVIGAQNIDLATGNWSRLNNAVMIFDKGHPLLRHFIEEFALTFDGNKWGHNGPYLVSRVVSRLSGKTGCNFTVVPPMAFYPVDWTKIGSLFQGPRSLNHSKWLFSKLKQIRTQSFAVHLWNKQSRQFKVEKGSIIQHIIFTSLVITTNSSSLV